MLQTGRQQNEDFITNFSLDLKSNKASLSKLFVFFILGHPVYIFNIHVIALYDFTSKQSNIKENKLTADTLYTTTFKNKEFYDRQTNLNGKRCLKTPATIPLQSTLKSQLLSRNISVLIMVSLKNQANDTFLISEVNAG